MNQLNSTYIKLLDKISKRFVTLGLILIIGFTLLQYPNPITHECVPNVRTQLGLSSEGYPYQKHFCDDGYYPVLKFGLEDKLANDIQVFGILLAMMGLVPVAYLIITDRLRNKPKK